MNSDEIVNKILKYGDVSIGHSRGMFRASIELDIIGLHEKVQTHFNHPTLLSALKDLEKKIINTPLIIHYAGGYR